MTQLETTPELPTKPMPADAATEAETTISSNSSNASNASSPGGSGTEKPVRRKLKKTQISQKEIASIEQNDTNGHAADDDLPTTTVRGRRLRKRSHDDVTEDNDNTTKPATPSAGDHIRKTSRDVKTPTSRKSASKSGSPSSVDEEGQKTSKRAKKSPAPKTNATSKSPKGKSPRTKPVQRTPSLSPKQQAAAKTSPKRKREDDDNEDEDDAKETKQNGSEKRIIQKRRLSDEKKESQSKEDAAPKSEEVNQAKTTSEPTETSVETKTEEPVNGTDIAAKAEEPAAPAVNDKNLQAPVTSSEPANEAPSTTAEASEASKAQGPAVMESTTQQEPAAASETTDEATEPTKSEKPAITAPSTQAESIPEKPTPKYTFGNTSIMYPFGSLNTSKPAEAETKSKEEPTTTSSSAFASSGFAKLANTSSPFAGAGSTNVFGGSASYASPFGGLSSTSSSVFGGATKDTSSTSTASPFASAGGSVFGSGFSSSFGSGPKLTSFASPNVAPASESEKKVKAFGEPDSAGEEEDDGEDDGEEGEGEGEAADGDESRDVESGIKHDGEEGSKKAVPIEVDTGEEEEDTAIALSGKIFEFSLTTRKWAERGSGQFKINTRVEITEDNKEKVYARIIMRARATHRVLLNVPIFKGMKVQASMKQITFSVPAEGGEALVPYLFRMGKEEDAEALAMVMNEIQHDL